MFKETKSPAERKNNLYIIFFLLICKWKIKLKLLIMTTYLIQKTLLITNEVACAELIYYDGQYIYYLQVFLEKCMKKF